MGANLGQHQSLDMPYKLALICGTMQALLCVYGTQSNWEGCK